MTRLLPAPPGLVTDGSLRIGPPRRSARQRATEKGAELERKARRMYEATGHIVETAPKVVVWMPGPTPTSPRVPRSTRHDLFGLWDLIAVTLTGRVAFVQVTDLSNKAAHRKKILETEWPQSQEYKDDVILCWAGKGIFRVFLGPDFTREAMPRHVPPERRKAKK